MFWLLLAILVLLGAYSMARRRRSYLSSEGDEPWRASLQDDEPLDIEEARRAEEEWLDDTGWRGAEDEEWR